MDPQLRRRMLAYYDERAPEYDEAYTAGTGSASIPDPELFKREAIDLAGVVARVVRGRVLDLACGTAYWLPHYARNSSQVTLFDQSNRMLAESRAKADRLGVANRCTFIQGDLVDHDFGPPAYDTVLVGFLLSHLTEDEERHTFGVIRRVLVPGGSFLILESAWTSERAKFNAKEERQARQLSDGTPFEIYKRYFDRDDCARWTREYGAALHVEYFGSAFLAVSSMQPRAIRFR